MKAPEILGNKPRKIAAIFEKDWNASPGGITDMDLPFRIRPTYPTIKHFTVEGNGEFLVVKHPEPYMPQEVWEACERDYKLDARAVDGDVTVYQVNPGLITLPALMNDAMSAEGKPKLVKKAFREVGRMLRDLNDTSIELRGTPITPDIQLGDIAFIKGEKDPLILPHFDLDAGIELAEVVNDLSYEISQTPLNEAQRAVARQALVALEVQLV